MILCGKSMIYDRVRKKSESRQYYIFPDLQGAVSQGVPAQAAMEMNPAPSFARCS